MSADEHRPSAAERHHELAMAAISRAPAPPEHTAEITRNLKGAWQTRVHAMRRKESDPVLYDEALLTVTRVSGLRDAPSYGFRLFGQEPQVILTHGQALVLTAALVVEMHGSRAAGLGDQ